MRRARGRSSRWRPTSPTCRPGTNIGAASPVGSNGEDIPGTLGEKVKNDAIANITSIAETRGRPVDWAVSTVSEAKSYTATEAVAAGAVDGIASTIDDVLAKANGQEVTVGGVPQTLDLTGVGVVDNGMNPLQGLLHLLSDPNIAFVLFTIGVYGLIFELQNPNFVTGILGALAIILAFIGFGSLPLNLAGPDADRAGRRAVRARGHRHQPRPARDRRDHLLRAGGVCPVHDAGRPDRADRRGGAAADRDQHRDDGHPHGPDHARRRSGPATWRHPPTRSATPCRWAPRASSRRRSSRSAPPISPASRGARGPRTPATLARDTPVRLVGFDGLTAIVEPTGERGADRATDPAICRRKAYPLREGRRPPPVARRRHAWSWIVVLAALAFFGVFVLIVLYLSVRVVQQYEQMVVFRLGKTNEGLVRGPGLRFLIPIIDRPVKVDVREQFIEVPSQTTITKDNAPISVDFLIYWRIVDPLKSIVNVAYFAGALQGVATTTLRAVIGDILLDDVLSRRDQINEVLRTKLDESTETWGGKVTRVEIREITPPRDVQDAMNRQLSAERTRRAVITESEGARQSAINVAEGQKQSEILKAEGERQAAILRAEGFSQALERIYSAAHIIDEKTMTLQYLEALKALGAEPVDEVRDPDRVHAPRGAGRRVRRGGHPCRSRPPRAGGRTRGDRRRHGPGGRDRAGRRDGLTAAAWDHPGPMASGAPVPGPYTDLRRRRGPSVLLAAV